jgi:outer membrane lipoprotein-sorting protein
MFRRHLIAALVSVLAVGAAAAAPVPPPPPPGASLSAEDRALVDKAVAYLDSLGEARGRFVQTDPKGRTSGGDLYLDRPGKARFEYGSPATLLVVADGRSVAVLDRRLKTFQRYALGSTPLALFLQRPVKLGGKVEVTHVERSAGGFSLTAKSGVRGMKGQITLTFSDEPVAIQQWSLVDAQGARTTVRITGLEPAHGLDPGLFVLRDPSNPGSL